MNTVELLDELRGKIYSWKHSGLSVGFVPTMGNLHAGHLSLVKLAQQYCDKVVVSIFVNPMQFGPDEDFDCYPRTFQEDFDKLLNIGVDLLYVPAIKDMYPGGVEQTVVRVPEQLTGLLEGASRPGHFDGVTTVVCKLFNMVQPDVAIFGEKDYQQLCIIQTMVQDLNIPVKIIAAPIARDTDGLALSSRNQYLSKVERAIAPKLAFVLQEVAQAITSGNNEFDSLTTQATLQLLEAGFDSVDYVQICDVNTLTPVSSCCRDGACHDKTSLIILAAAYLGNTRLLDNKRVC